MVVVMATVFMIRRGHTATVDKIRLVLRSIFYIRWHKEWNGMSSPYFSIHRLCVDRLIPEADSIGPLCLIMEPRGAGPIGVVSTRPPPLLPSHHFTRYSDRYMLHTCFGNNTAHVPKPRHYYM
ncbi:hypothetical protein F4809DRAFT_303013 [Biscogniauxia mediterranea]|nr:hypothetical protein F4809DRAFT_303013 [Biscogniauxia mediterranea]